MSKYNAVRPISLVAIDAAVGVSLEVRLNGP